MMTVRQVSDKTGVSIRTLHHYDSIGLLRPSAVSEAGYRLYDEEALERLQCILMFRELQFPLKEIRRIMDSPDFDRNRALEQQITLLELRREHIDHLITLARGVWMLGVKCMDFKAFDTRKIDEYLEQARNSWSDTPTWQEYEQKHSGLSDEQEQAIAEGLMAVIGEFSPLRDQPAASPAAQAAVKRLQDYMTAHYYTCTDQILKGLGKMYGGGGSFTENINQACGDGTAEFVAAAIAAYTA